MFDFLKKSRAVKFLCSACLLCSLGSFAVSAADNDPTQVAEAYVQGELGFDADKISFEDSLATIDSQGKLSGTLTWKTGNESSGYDYAPLINANEDAELTLFLVNDEDKQVATTGSIGLSEYNGSDPSGPYNISKPLYAVTNDVAGNYTYKTQTDTNLYSPATPQVLKVFGIVTRSGITSLFAGPNYEPQESQ